MFLLFAIGVATTIFLGSLLLMEYGRRLGARRLAEHADQPSGLNAVEGAVFALMGLLLAFTISGALQRFDERRQLILQEANAIGTAYDRLDLLHDDARLRLSEEFKEYLRSRIAHYLLPIEYSILQAEEVFSGDQEAKVKASKERLWKDAVASCRATSDTTACVLLLPSLNAAFEAARSRRGVNERHPPNIIYVMLFGFGLGASLLAGFGMGGSGSRSWLHMLTFAGALAVTLYVITDIEFPRLGVIRVDYFDHFLKEVLSQMR